MERGDPLFRQRKGGRLLYPGMTRPRHWTNVIEIEKRKGGAVRCIRFSFYIMHSSYNWLDYWAYFLKFFSFYFKMKITFLKKTLGLSLHLDINNNIFLSKIFIINIRIFFLYTWKLLLYIFPDSPQMHIPKAITRLIFSVYYFMI